MLARSATVQLTLPAPEQDFALLSETQRRKLGQLIAKLVKLQHVPQKTMLVIWREAGLTNASGSDHISSCLGNHPRTPLTWRHVTVTCQAIGMEPATVLAGFEQPLLQACLHVIRHIPDPALQLAMLVNGWRKISLPCLVGRKTQKLARGRRQLIQRRWHGAGLVSSTAVGTQAFMIKSCVAWQRDMATIAIRCFGTRGETLCAELIELIEQHDPGPAS